MRKSKGALEREDTAYLLGTVPIGVRAQRRYARMGVKPEHMPKRSLFVVLDGTCQRWARKHRNTLKDPQHNYRARYYMKGVPMNYTQVEQ